MVRNAVFIFGAGASADLGLPVMAGFMNKVKALESDGKLPTDIREDFRQVIFELSSSQYTHSDAFDSNNVEQVFSLWQMESEIGRPDSRKKIDALVNTIAYTCEASYSWKRWNPPSRRVPPLWTPKKGRCKQDLDQMVWSIIGESSSDA